jgi:acyl carrier protein
MEVGPGRTLSTLARQNSAKTASHEIANSIRHPNEQSSDVAFLLNTLGRLWLAGVQPDWSNFYENEERMRIPLPPYPFERQRYWVEAKRYAGAATVIADDTDDSLETIAVRPALPTVYAGATNPTEQSILDIWQEILGISQIGIHDNFFELGGHSLLATQIVSRLRHAFEVQVPLRTIFENPTTVELAAAIEDILIAEVEKVTDEEAERMLEQTHV